MRLTTLEIKGFKSFGDKVTIHFDKGVTSIVGPNGSGKSNVVDAMRWVLGEQKTRMLRSEKMENIIFNGTKNRKPSNLAEVSLSFENTKNILPTEFSNITITRKLYRTGESEYLLNGVPCRLKDITDLFLDTGIGSDTYSIIELKMIDEIINDKNNTIKSLFEEAAGISKYKVRKKQTLQKLEETDADLNRVNDLLFEIEKNLKSLESQARKTERFYKLREQYKELSTKLACFTVASYKETFDRLLVQEEKLKDERTQAEAQIDVVEAELQKLKLENTDNEKHLSASQKALNEKINYIRQAENEKKIKNERLKFLQDKEASLTQQLFNDKKYKDELEDSLKHLAGEKEKESKAVEELQGVVAGLKAEVEEFRAKLSAMQVDINAKAKELSLLQEETHKLEKSYAIQQTQKESLVKELDRFSLENSAREKEKENLDMQFDQIQLSRESKETACSEALESEEEHTIMLKELEQTLKGKQEELVSLNRRIDAKQNEYNLTKSLIDNLEGFPESIKFLKKNSAPTRSAPLLSDVISCKPEYKICIENFLEPYMNYFLVDTREEALQSVNILSEASQGRAHFFILGNIRNPEPSPVIEGYTRALDIIEVDNRFQALCNYLLDKVYIGSDITDRELSGDDLILLSESGKYQKTAFTLSGGSVGLFEGKRIGRAKNLEILEKDIAELAKERESLKLETESLQTLISRKKSEQASSVARKNELQKELNLMNTQLAALQAKKDQLNLFLSTNSKRIEDISAQLRLIDSDNPAEENFSSRISGLNETRSALQDTLSTLQENYRQLNNGFNEKSSYYNQQNISFLQQQNKLNTIIRELTYKQTQAETLSKSIASNSEELEKIKEQVGEILQNSSDGDDQMISYYEEKESLEKAVKELEAVYYKTRGAIDETETKIRELRKKKEHIDILFQELKDKVTDIKIQLNSLKERLSVEFGINLETLIEQAPDPEFTEADLKEKVEKLKSQIANFGPINPMAIEAYKEINERFVFINQQKEDLLKAKESLLQTISEIDSTAKEKFMEAFIQIRSNFITVFRSLFSEEDNCDLVLSEPGNPLESDINITAQPKGKRPLSINQLSGGEKTLTATALLFGIYLLKPAPFCIFDEVDAPLDDNNIDKFNRIIKKFSEDSQFIIITHNKRTMASTDIIYGVTMIELGVTQVVPVDIREVA